VKAYDLVEEERDGKRYQKLVDGGQIELSNFKTSGHGVHGRVSVCRFLSQDSRWWSTSHMLTFVRARKLN
jgi:hypothetical protein